MWSGGSSPSRAGLDVVFRMPRNNRLHFNFTGNIMGVDYRQLSAGTSHIATFVPGRCCKN